MLKKIFVALVLFSSYGFSYGAHFDNAHEERSEAETQLIELGYPQENIDIVGDLFFTNRSNQILLKKIELRLSEIQESSFRFNDEKKSLLTYMMAVNNYYIIRNTPPEITERKQVSDLGNNLTIEQDNADTYLMYKGKTVRTLKYIDYNYIILDIDPSTDWNEGRLAALRGGWRFKGIFEDSLVVTQQIWESERVDVINIEESTLIYTGHSKVIDVQGGESGVYILNNTERGFLIPLIQVTNGNTYTLFAGIERVFYDYQSIELLSKKRIKLIYKEKGALKEEIIDVK